MVRRYVLRSELGAAADFRAINNLIAELAERGKRPGVTLAPGILRSPRLNVDANERDLMIASILARLQA